MSTEPSAPVPSSGGSAAPVQASRGDGHDGPVTAPFVKPPDNSIVYKTCIAVIALRAQGVSADDIAATVGYSKETIRTYLKRAHARGWLNINSLPDVEDKIDIVLKDKVVRNVNEFLDERDKDVTVEAAKGFGIFKQHQVIKGDQNLSVGMSLRVQVEMPPTPHGGSPIIIRPGTAGGVRGMDIPLDAEIIETEE